MMALGLLSLATQVPAATVGYSSNTANIVVGGTNTVSPSHPGTAGAPGIGVAAAASPFNMVIGFAGLAGMAPADGNRVHVISTAMMPPSHAALGNFNFAKVDSAAADVYFGEWKNGNQATSSHTVYYAGAEKTTNMPTLGSADYSIKGLNNYNGNNLMAGNLHVDFGTRSFTGGLSNQSLNIAMEGVVNMADASFIGAAQANNSIRGTAQGNFFGANAAAVAGTATFNGHRELDTAFGGSR